MKIPQIPIQSQIEQCQTLAFSVLVQPSYDALKPWKPWKPWKIRIKKIFQQRKLYKWCMISGF